ncbi:hypothetical protein [Pseudohaliea rubra]|nr:hypothetical protein [Pseudohaliea rubra]
MRRRSLALFLLIPFAAYSAYALYAVGLGGILSAHASVGGVQVFADLVIALLLVLSFLVPHARARGRRAWPWVLLTLALGSPGPLCYFAFAAGDD